MVKDNGRQLPTIPFYPLDICLAMWYDIAIINRTLIIEY